MMGTGDKIVGGSVQLECFRLAAVSRNQNLDPRASRNNEAVVVRELSACVRSLASSAFAPTDVPARGNWPGDVPMSARALGKHQAKCDNIAGKQEGTVTQITWLGIWHAAALFKNRVRCPCPSESF
jgi:hypothetical protein